MDASFEVSDPSDWLQTPVKQLAAVESALRCQVCKDFFDTPMITSCSHTFCSLCIRRCLTNDGKCPTCRTADQELRLRRNWALEETVQAFKDARPALIGFSQELQVAKEEKELRGSKRKIAEINGDSTMVNGQPSTSRRKTRSQSRRTPETRPVAPQQIQDSEEDEDYQTEDGLIACPICGKRMKEEQVFPHLDVHNEPAPNTNGRSSSSRNTPVEVPSRSRPSSKPMERLPQISYGLMKDQAMRKKLAELGIPNGGPRPLLNKRHTEWVNLVNSNCDSSKPRSKRELLAELETWERSQGRNILNGLGGVETNSVMRKDFDGAAWAANHGNEFQRLIAKAKTKAKTKAEEQAQTDSLIKGSDEPSGAGPPIQEPLEKADTASDQPASIALDTPTPPDVSQGKGDQVNTISDHEQTLVLDSQGGG